MRKERPRAQDRGGGRAQEARGHPHGLTRPIPSRDRPAIGAGGPRPQTANAPPETAGRLHHSIGDKLLLVLINVDRKETIALRWHVDVRHGFIIDANMVRLGRFGHLGHLGGWLGLPLRGRDRAGLG